MNYNMIHKKMIRHVFLQTELLINDDIIELSEYDIQAMIFTFFRTRLGMFHLSETTRERQGRTDIVVKSMNEPDVYIELKTYFKSNEHFTDTHFNADIKKLADKVAAGGIRAFFVIAGLKEKFNDHRIDRYEFLWSKREFKRNYIEYSIPDSEQPVIMRPSRGERWGRTHLWSWEIMGTKQS